MCIYINTYTSLKIQFIPTSNTKLTTRLVPVVPIIPLHCEGLDSPQVRSSPAEDDPRLGNLPTIDVHGVQWMFLAGNIIYHI